jgi:pilus assembly protein FimV
VAPEPALQEAWDADTGATGQFSFEDLDAAARERAAEPGFTEESEFESGSFDSATPVPEGEAPAPLEPPAAHGDAAAGDARYEYGGDDAASTKLELARAYLDMGDVEGARGMLEEVMGEGNAGQRAEARRLLDEIR